MKTAKYIRVGLMIFNADDRGTILREGKDRQPVLHKQFSSLNLAKKESHSLQIDEDKKLGLGTVKVRTK